MHTVSILTSDGTRYSEPVAVATLHEAIAFPVCKSGVSIITHCEVDGVVHPLDAPVTISPQLQPRFPRGSIKP